MEHKKISMKASILWNSWGSIFYLGCQWLLTVLVVRLAGVEESGILSLAMSVSNIWYSLAVYGMRNYQGVGCDRQIQKRYLYLQQVDYRIFIPGRLCDLYGGDFLFAGTEALYPDLFSL